MKCRCQSDCLVLHWHTEGCQWDLSFCLCVSQCICCAGHTYGCRTCKRIGNSNLYSKDLSCVIVHVLCYMKSVLPTGWAYCVKDSAFTHAYGWQLHACPWNVLANERKCYICNGFSHWPNERRHYKYDIFSHWLRHCKGKENQPKTEAEFNIAWLYRKLI